MTEIDALKSEIKKLRAEVNVLKDKVEDPDKYLTREEAIQLEDARKEYRSGKTTSHPDFE